MSKKIENFIETNKLWISGVIIFLILLGSSILLYRENYSKISYDDRIKNLEAKINQLENSVSTLSQNVQTSNVEKSESKPAETTQPSQSTTGTVAGTSTKSTTTSPPITGKININTATLSELDTLPGIGQTYAQRIIDYRNTNGPFKNIEEVKNVKGIGDKTFEKFKDKITIN